MALDFMRFPEPWCWVCADYSDAEAECDDCGDQLCLCHMAIDGRIHRCPDCEDVRIRNMGRARALEARAPGTPGVPSGFDGVTWVSWRRARKMHLLWEHSLVTVCGATPWFGWSGEWGRESCKRCDNEYRRWRFWSVCIHKPYFIPKREWIGMGTRRQEA